MLNHSSTFHGFFATFFYVCACMSVLVTSKKANANEILNLPHLNGAISYSRFVGDAIPMTKMEENVTTKAQCSFIGAYCPIEKVEHDLVREFIRETDSVLETGARYGTTSCEIAFKQKNSGLLVSVEPDSSVWPSLHSNRQSHNCNFHLLQGVVSNRPMEHRHTPG